MYRECVPVESAVGGDGEANYQYATTINTTVMDVPLLNNSVTFTVDLEQLKAYLVCEWQAQQHLE